MTQSGADTWDFVIIGGGPPGENAAQYAIQGSDRTAVIIEEQLVGGECSYWACMPSKALLRPGEVLRAARDLPGTSALVSTAGAGPSLDVAAVLARRDAIVHDHDDGSQVEWAQGAGIDVLRGRGELAGERTVDVMAADGTRHTVHARQAVVLATGTTATVPPIAGLADALPWISRDATNLHEVPARIAIIGGGVVACEAATWLADLGAEVTILTPDERLLARTEPFAGELVRAALAERGVTIRLGTRVEQVAREAPRDTGEGWIHGGPVTVRAGDESVSADEVLVAAGRTPASAQLQLDRVRLADGRSLAEVAGADHGFVTVDDHLAVPGVPGGWLYAVGDLSGRALLTHMGKYQARLCGAVLAARAEGRPVDGPWTTDRSDHGAVPQVTFTDPQVASVGLTEAEAHSAGIDVETIEYDLGQLAGTYLQRENYTGRAKIVIDRAADLLVGATFVGPDVADLLHAATVAIIGRVTLADLWHAVPAYPTPSEVWLRLLETRYNPA